MTPDEDVHEALAADLSDAHATGEPLAPLGEEADLTVDDGYAIQARLNEHRRRDEGEPVGYKIGVTSAAIQETLGIPEPIYGEVLDGTVISEGPFEVEGLIAPRIEAEIAFVVGDDLDDGATRLDVLASTTAVFPAIEVVDSRYRGWEFGATGAIADNACSGRVVHGDRLHDPTGRDLSLEGVTVLKNGRLEATGVGADVLGSPVEAVRWLATELADRGGRLQSGSLVLTGSVIPLVAIEPGDVIEARFSTLGSVTTRAE